MERERDSKRGVELGLELLRAARAQNVAVSMFADGLAVWGANPPPSLVRHLYQRELEVLAALQREPVSRPEWNTGAGDRDEPYRYPGVDLERVLGSRVFERLRAARGRWAAVPPGVR